MDKLKALVVLALDLTAELSAEDRYDRLLGSLHRAIPYDAAMLLRVEKNCLIPLEIVSPRTTVSVGGM